MLSTSLAPFSAGGGASATRCVVVPRGMRLYLRHELSGMHQLEFGLSPVRHQLRGMAKAVTCFGLEWRRACPEIVGGFAFSEGHSRHGL